MQIRFWTTSFFQPNPFPNQAPIDYSAAEFFYSARQGQRLKESRKTLPGLVVIQDLVICDK